MELTADQLRAIILAEAQKIENEGATRLEEEAVSLDIETLRAIIQEEAQLFEEGYKMSEMDVYEEGDVDMSEGHYGKDYLSMTHGLNSDPDLDYAMDEESFAKEIDHDDADIIHLRHIRDALNDHIHNLEMQDDRAHDHRRHMHEEELPAELSEEEADEGHCGGVRMEEEMIGEDADTEKAEKEARAKLTDQELRDLERAKEAHKKAKERFGDALPSSTNESVEAENLNESAAPSNPAVSRWMQIAGL